VRILEGRGFRRVAIVPLLLGNGKHATLELDEVLDGLRREMPQVELHLAEGLGADPNLAELVVERLRGVGGLPGARPGIRRPTGVLLVKAGTKTLYDDCQWLKELGQLVEQRLGPEFAVAVAQSHYGDPTIESAAAHLVGERRASSIVCVPYLLFPGIILRRNVLGGMALLKEQYPGLPMAVTPPLGVDDRLVSLTAEKVQEVWARAESNGAQTTLRSGTALADTALDE
jgi:sirohydrochlorin ferrochelatase